MGGLYLIQIYSANPGLCAIPVTLYLKETLGLSATHVAGFQAVIFMPWAVKPIWGLVCDSFLLFGYRLKGYFLLCYGLTIALFLGLSQAPSPSLTTLVVVGISISVCVAFTDVLTDRLMITEGQAQQNTGMLQSAQWTAMGFGSASAFVIGGWLAAHQPLSLAFLLSALVPLVGSGVVLWGLRDNITPQPSVAIRATFSALRQTLTDRPFLVVMGIMLLVGIMPIPPVLFYERDGLKFGEEVLGNLRAIESLGLGLGALGFGLLAKRLSWQWLPKLAIGFSSLHTLAWLFLRDFPSAMVTHLIAGILMGIQTLSFLEMAARVCPTTIPATAYALLLSVSNLAISLGGLSGSWLYDLKLSFVGVVMIGAIATALCSLALPLVSSISESPKAER